MIIILEKRTNTSNLKIQWYVVIIFTEFVYIFLFRRLYWLVLKKKFQIPISAATEIQQRRTPIPYYPPPKNVPAIKFDHPVQINGLQYPQPISPAPGLQPNSYPTGPHNNYPAGPPTSEDGFIPLFMPDKSDPVLTQRIEKLPPEGYTLPNYGHTGKFCLQQLLSLLRFFCLHFYWVFFFSRALSQFRSYTRISTGIPETPTAITRPRNTYCIC